MSEALSGIRIVDLSRLAPGPYATRLLAELGADVIKIEPRDGGDYARWWPPLVGEPPTGFIFRELNRGKQSVALDLKTKEALDALEALIARADVLVDGFRPGVLARLGLDPERLQCEHPRLIYCAITGFGLTGPDAQRAGHDIGYTARAGTLAMSGTALTPATLGVQVADFAGALTAVSGILAALFQRTRTGRGQTVDVSLTESAMAMGAINFAMVDAGAEFERGNGLLDGSRPCYSIYETKDGRHLAVGALEPKFWQAFVDAIELPHLSVSGLDEGEAGAKVRAEVQARLLEQPLEHWRTLFRRVEACVEPVLSPEEALEDPHWRARAGSGAGYVASALRLGVSGDPLSAAPALGEHTQSVLEAVGLAPSQIARLLES